LTQARVWPASRGRAGRSGGAPPVLPPTVELLVNRVAGPGARDAGSTVTGLRVHLGWGGVASPDSSDPRCRWQQTRRPLSRAPDVPRRSKGARREAHRMDRRVRCRGDRVRNAHRVAQRGDRTQSWTSPPIWTPAVLALAEAVLCGVSATVAATKCRDWIVDRNLHERAAHVDRPWACSPRRYLGAEVPRGRIVDADSFLDAYASSAVALAPKESLQVGVSWRDAIAGAADAGPPARQRRRRLGGDRSCRLHGDPRRFLTTVSTADVYVDASNPGTAGCRGQQGSGCVPLTAVASRCGPFPTASTRRLAEMTDGLRVAPWPRVFADPPRERVCAAKNQPSICGRSSVDAEPPAVLERRRSGGRGCARPRRAPLRLAGPEFVVLGGAGPPNSCAPGVSFSTRARRDVDVPGEPRDRLRRCQHRSPRASAA